MTAHGGSSDQDERETTNTAAATAGRRRRAPAARRPGVRVRRRPRAGADRPATPDAAPRATRDPAAEQALAATPEHDTGRRAPSVGDDLTTCRHVDLGPVILSVVSPPALPAVEEVKARHAGARGRTWLLVVASGGPLVVEDGRGLSVRLEAGSVTLGEPCERLRLSAGAADGPEPAQALVLHVPETALPLPGEVLRGVAGRPTPTHSGPAALLASFAHGLAVHTPSAGARHARWLGTAAVNLVTAFLDDEATQPPRSRAIPHPSEPAPGRPRPAPSAGDLLLRDIKAHIERHLGDPALSPTSIAAAGHISLRYLHHLFQRDDRTVGAFLRERRLEHCRAELSDPAHAHRSVCEIARRWGFRDPAVFNRTFKSAYGVTPGAYRTRPVPSASAGEELREDARRLR